MRNFLIVIVALSLCSSAWASRGRPVSDLRFDGSVVLANGFVASDGKDFMVLSTTSSGLDPHVYLQRVVGGRPAGPCLEIAGGIASGIAWTGTDYLIAWSSDGLWTARVSRQGALVETPAKRAKAGYFASNGQSALTVSWIDNTTLSAQPLDLAGAPSGPAVPLNLPFGGSVNVGPSPNGYAIVCTGYQATLLLRVRPDGTPLDTSPITLEGPYAVNDGYSSQDSSIASDGTDTLIVFTGEKNLTGAQVKQVKSVIIGADGSIKHAARTLATIQGLARISVPPASVVWTGSQYVAALSVPKDPAGTTTDTGLLTINRNGEAVGDVAYITNGERRKSAFGLGWNGNELLVPWYDSNSNNDFGAFCAAVPMATMTSSTPAALGRALNTQSGLAIAAVKGQYLAAWFETGAVITVRASRIDKDGNFLDGEGIALGTVPTPPRYTTPSIAIDSDGTNWLVVWASGGVRGRRLSRAGALLDAESFPIAYGYDVAVRWNGANYVVVAANDSLVSAAVSRDGAVTATKTLAASTSEYGPLNSTTINYTSPSLAVVHGETMAAYLKVVSGCSGIQGTCQTVSTILGVRLDSSASPLDATPFSIATNVWSKPSLATDGTRLLAAWSAYDPAYPSGSAFGAFFSADAPQQPGTPFRIAPNANVTDTAFDNGDYLVAFQSARSPNTIGTVRLTAAGAVTNSVMLPLDEAEAAMEPRIAVSPGMPPLLGYASLRHDSDHLWRGALLFDTEFAAPLAVPAPPEIAGALRIDQNTIDVRWQAAADAIGTSVELQLEDGAYRTIGVAAGGITNGRFSLAGLQGPAVRIRSWNAAGLSDASRTVPIALPRQHAIRAH